jgi:F-type H+-transporting ATPase subunit gamma
MTLSIRQLRTRITSIAGTEKVMNVMEMISTAKLKPLQARVLIYRKFFARLSEVVNDVLSSGHEIDHPLMEHRSGANGVTLCVMASDAGLCGPYNHVILRAADEFLKKRSADNIKLITIGKKANTYFKNSGYGIFHDFSGLLGTYTEEFADRIFDYLTKIFIAKKTDEVYVAYTYFDTSSHQKPIIEKVLNIAPAKKTDKRFFSDPGMEELTGSLLPFYLRNKVRTLLLNAIISEHCARVLAMKEAGENAGEILDELVLTRNKLRQSLITQELLEVISSADALKGQ